MCLLSPFTDSEVRLYGETLFIQHRSWPEVVTVTEVGPHPPWRS